MPRKRKLNMELNEMKKRVLYQTEGRKAINCIIVNYMVKIIE